MATAPDPQTPGEALPVPGDVLAGKYRVERVVGAGGMGVVVAATHLQLEEKVALKLLKRDVTRPDTIGRFLREARAAAKIKSEHVARVTDVGTLATGSPYMVMELLEGEDLGHRVRTRGPLDPAQAADYLLQACEAVAEAHSLGIVHRDLKPANLFLARRPGGQRVVKVVDFGISKQIGEGGAPSPMEEASRTRTSAWLGSPLYMSPEQMRSAKDVDTRTDIWALGLILFELCTGHVPFDAPSMVELCGRVLHDQPTPIQTWLPDPPSALVRVVERCLRKNREERYATVAELARDLAALAPGSRDRVERIVAIVEAAGLATTDPAQEEDEKPLPLMRPSAPSAPARTAARPSVPEPAASVPVREEPRRRGAMAGLALLLLLGGGYLRFQAGAWPFAPRPTREIAPEVPPSASPPPVASSSAPLPSVAPPPVATIVDAGRIQDVGADAGRPDAGARRTGPRGPAAAPEPAAGNPSPPPVPASALRPEVITESCSRILPDGTRQSIPCP